MTEFIMASHGLIEKDGAYLFTRRSIKNDYMPLLWDIPGGKVDAGETMEAGLTREIKEETGLEVAIQEPLFIYTNKKGLPERQYFQAVYRCRYVSGEITLNPEEHDQYAWLTIPEFKTEEAIAFLKEFLEKHADRI